MDVSVIGNGRWGAFLAWYLAQSGHSVRLCGRENSQHTKAFLQTRANSFLTLPDNVELTCQLEKALENKLIIVSVPSQNLRDVLATCTKAGAKERLFVLCMKGLEMGSGKRLSQVFLEECGEQNRCAVWLGPGHVQDFVRGVPNCMVIDAENEADKHMLVGAFSGELIRFYYGQDLIGNEIGAAAKNVVGIAAGMLDAFALSSLKGALMSRGCREYARLIEALGGSAHSAYGLCHLGDYEATVFSQHSQNRMFGESFSKGLPFEKLAEGYYTVAALMELAKSAKVELPITRAIYAILYEKQPPKEALNMLFSRSLKEEFA